MRSAPVGLLVGIVFRDASATLAEAVDAVLGQRGESFRAAVLLVDDGSVDDWRAALGDRLRVPHVHHRRVAFRSTARSRNYVLDEAVLSFPDAEYVCRLDSDDVLASPWAFEELSSHLRRERPDALLAGNLQAVDGVVLPRANRAIPDLLDPQRLLERLDCMAAGDPAAELPSCNMVVRRGLPVRYPLVRSAEDHWYTVSILLDAPRWKVVVVPELLYAIYRLTGRVTAHNRRSDDYLASRAELAAFARRHVEGRTHDG